MINILFLHGYRQNEIIFREIVEKNLGDIFRNEINLLFCQGPHIILPFKGVNGESLPNQNDNERGWWLSDFDPTYNEHNLKESESGLEQSLIYLDDIFEKFGPIDGVFGFSQGASLTSILSLISSSNSDKYKSIRFKFCIFVSGFKSEKLAHEEFYKQNNVILNLPSLHIFGKLDEIITRDMSLKLANDTYLNPVLHEHSLDHIVPFDKESQLVISNFLSEMKNKSK